MSAPTPFRWSPAALDGKADPAVNDAIQQAFYRLQQQLDTIKAHTKAMMQTQSDVATLQANLATAQQQLAKLGAVATIGAGQSTLLKNQASQLPTFSGAFAYTATTTSITWYWDGTNGSTLLTLLWPDGSQTPITPGNLTITGLTANTTYLFYPFVNPQTTVIGFVGGIAGGTGTPSVAFTAASPEAAQLEYADGNSPMSVSAMSAATPSTGTGGGSGGGSGGAGRPVIFP